jgi:type IV pilus assembly protein PilA
MTAQSNKQLNTSKGFTLIELLVTIAIIAIISVVAVALFGNVQQKARDGKRVAELETIANALEINKTNGGQYNAFATTQFAGGVIPALDPGGVNNYCISNSSATTAPVAGNWPNCTTGTAGYTTLANFAPTAATTSYKICTLREIDTPLVFCRTNTQ